ncbi:MAG: dapC [Candidatus Brocadiaceae bacterium]|nr:dapC [Candidatus Brocadiaceae bacterium]
MEITASKRLQSIGAYAFAEVDKEVEKLKALGITPIDFGVGDPTAAGHCAMDAEAVWREYGTGYGNIIHHRLERGGV